MTMVAGVGHQAHREPAPQRHVQKEPTLHATALGVILAGLRARRDFALERPAPRDFALEHPALRDSALDHPAPRVRTANAAA